MPVQRGKKRKRPRRRGAGPGADSLVETPEAAPVVSSKRRSGSIMRRGWEPPMWVNLVIGLFLLVLGILFTVRPGSGIGTGGHLLILFGYCALAGLYLGKAFRQYQRKRRS